LFERHLASQLQFRGTVRVFRQKFTLEDAIGSHACSLEANMRVTNGIPLGCPLLLPVDTVICVQTLKVFRVLLMYHDAELCALLDTHRVGPKDFAQTWIRSMFSHTCGPDVILPLWDAYFLADDPFFVFFLALVMLINGKDYVLELAENPATLGSELASMPSGLSADDVGDMCDLARHFSSITPSSFRADFNSRLFNSAGRRQPKVSDATAALQIDLYEKLCLCVSVDTVLRHTEGAIKFFVIDIRPIAQYDAGHLPYAWHLDATLMLDNPTVFAQEVEQLEEALQASLQHPTFLGSGRTDEDQSLSMVVSHFLQRKHQYVSIVKGGFQSLHAKLETEGRTTSALTGHSPARMLAFVDPAEAAAAAAASAAAAPEKKRKGKEWGWGKKSGEEKKKEGTEASASRFSLGGWGKKAASSSATDGGGGAPAAAEGVEVQEDQSDNSAEEEKSATKWGSKLKGWGNAFKESVKEAAIATGNKADELAEATSVASKKLQAKTKEATERMKDQAKEALAKRAEKKQGGEGMYRGGERPMFSIDDDDDDEPDRHAGGKGGGADLDLAGAVLRRSKAGELFVSVAKAIKEPAIVHSFECSEIGAEGYLFPSHLLLTQTHLIKLRDRSSKKGEAIVLSRRELSRIQKITAKKRHPNILTFIFDAQTERGNTPSPAPPQTTDAKAPDPATESSPPKPTGQVDAGVLDASMMVVAGDPTRNGPSTDGDGAGGGEGGEGGTAPARFSPGLDDSFQESEDGEEAGVGLAVDAGADADAAPAVDAEADAAPTEPTKTETGDAEAGDAATGDAATEDASQADGAERAEEPMSPLPTEKVPELVIAAQVTQVQERFMIPQARCSFFLQYFCAFEDAIH
jgi:hypothetical protein